MEIKTGMVFALEKTYCRPQTATPRKGSRKRVVSQKPAARLISLFREDAPICQPLLLTGTGPARRAPPGPLPAKDNAMRARQENQLCRLLAYVPPDGFASAPSRTNANQLYLSPRCPRPHGICNSGEGESRGCGQSAGRWTDD